MDIDNPKIPRDSNEYQRADSIFTAYVQDAIRRNDVVPVNLTIDPPMAQVMLDYNEGNRNIRPSKLDQYKRDMREGRYKFNGESLIVARNGRLNDGQHRLRAILETGLTFKSVVSFGVDPDAIDTIDLGSARSGADALNIDDVPNAAIASSLLKMVVSYERAMKESTVPAGHIILGSNSRVTVPEIRERYANSASSDRTLIEDAASYAASHSKSFQGLLNPQHVAFAYWLLGQIDQPATIAMLDKIRTQMGFTRGDPIFAAYNNLKRAATKQTKNTNERIEILVRGWNNMRRGKSINAFRVMDAIPVPK